MTVISRAEYRHLTERQVYGRKVRALDDLVTRRMRVTAGTVLTIRRKQSGYELETGPCPSCGVAMKVAKVPPSSLEWVTVPYPQGCLCERYPDGVALDCHVHNGGPLHFDSVCLAVPLEAIAAPTLNEDHPCHCP